LRKLQKVMKLAQKWKDFENNGTTWKLIQIFFPQVPMFYGYRQATSSSSTCTYFHHPGIYAAVNEMSDSVPPFRGRRQFDASSASNPEVAKHFPPTNTWRIKNKPVSYLRWVSRVHNSPRCRISVVMLLLEPSHFWRGMGQGMRQEIVMTTTTCALLTSLPGYL
jgi:hypothetical protein